MLHVYGDSFVNRDCIRGSSTATDVGFQDIIGNKLNIEVNSIGVPGCSNYDIVNLLTSRLHLYEPRDTVIVLLTSPDRRNFPNSEVPPSLGDVTVPSDLRKPKKTLVGIPIYSMAHAYLYEHKTEQELLDRFNKIRYIKIKKGRSKKEAIDRLIYDSIDSMYGMYEYYENYFYDWFRNLNVYFSKNNIIYKIYTYNWWSYIRDLQIEDQRASDYVPCECGHWNELGHKIFAEQVLSDLKDRKREIFHEPPRSTHTI